MVAAWNKRRRLLVGQKSEATFLMGRALATLDSAGPLFIYPQQASPFRWEFRFSELRSNAGACPFLFGTSGWGVVRVAVAWFWRSAFSDASHHNFSGCGSVAQECRLASSFVQGQALGEVYSVQGPQRDQGGL